MQDHTPQLPLFATTSTKSTRLSVEERFWKKVSGCHPSECWHWIGATTKTGYGCFRYQNRQDMAHRVSWELHFGPIPSGLSILHQCDNPSCVNPAHLFLGTQQDNIDDMMVKGRHATRRGESNFYAKLTDEQVVEIRLLSHNGIGKREIAKKFNVSRPTISQIVNRKTWRHLP